MAEKDFPVHTMQHKEE